MVKKALLMLSLVLALSACSPAHNAQEAGQHTHTEMANKDKGQKIETSQLDMSKILVDSDKMENAEYLFKEFPKDFKIYAPKKLMRNTLEQKNGKTLFKMCYISDKSIDEIKKWYQEHFDHVVDKVDINGPVGQVRVAEFKNKDGVVIKHLEYLMDGKVDFSAYEKKYPITIAIPEGMKRTGQDEIARYYDMKNKSFVETYNYNFTVAQKDRAKIREAIEKEIVIKQGYQEGVPHMGLPEGIDHFGGNWHENGLHYNFAGLYGDKDQDHYRLYIMQH